MEEQFINETPQYGTSGIDSDVSNESLNTKKYTTCYVIIVSIFSIFAGIYSFANFHQMLYLNEKRKDLVSFVKEILFLKEIEAENILDTAKYNFIYSILYLIFLATPLILAANSKSANPSILEWLFSIVSIIIMLFISDFEELLAYFRFGWWGWSIGIFSIFLLSHLSKNKFSEKMMFPSIIIFPCFFYYLTKVFFSATYEKNFPNNGSQTPIALLFNSENTKKDIQILNNYAEKYNFDKENMAYSMSLSDGRYNPNSNSDLKEIIHLPLQDFFNSYLKYTEVLAVEKHTLQIMNTIFPYMYLMKLNYFLYINVVKFTLSAISFIVFIFLAFKYEHKISFCRVISIFSPLYFVLHAVVSPMIIHPFSVYCYGKLYDEMIKSSSAEYYFKCFLFYNMKKQRLFYFLSPILQYFYNGPLLKELYEKLIHSKNPIPNEIVDMFN